MEPMDTTIPGEVSGADNMDLLNSPKSTRSNSPPKQLEVTIQETENHEKPVTPSGLLQCDNNSTLSLIHNNVLTPFRAKLPMAPWLKVVIPPGGYKCLDCGDTFLLDASLKQHLERRSVYIHFACEICKISLIYYNRCSLLAHARNHKSKNEQVDLAKAVVSPLSKELLISNLVSPVIYPGVNGSTCSALLSHLSRESSNEVSASHIKGGKYRCPECFQHFESADSREEHFSSGQSNPATLSQCIKCTMLCPSKCSLQAHQRIHLKILPFVCPECGEQCSNSWEQFMFHLENQCYHFSRSVTYNCTICDERHLASVALQKHILKAHTKTYVKCQACPMAFKGPSAFEYHSQVAHMGIGNHSKYIFKCPLCDTVFHGKDQLLNHLSIHINEQLSHTQYVFCCTECSAVHNSKYVLIAHLEAMHQKVRNISQSFENSLGLKTLNVPSTDDKLIGGESLTCPICNKIFNSNYSYSAHYKEHLNKDLKCLSCCVQFVSKNLLLAHEKKHLREGLFLCMICHKTGFVDGIELDQHLKWHVSEMVFPAKCYHCNYVLADEEVALFHFGCEHLLRSEVSTNAFNNKKHPCPYCNKHLSRKSMVSRHIAKFHKNSKPPDLNSSDDANLPPIKIRIPLQLVRSETVSSSLDATSPEKLPLTDNHFQFNHQLENSSDLNIRIENVTSVPPISKKEIRPSPRPKSLLANNNMFLPDGKSSSNSINETISEVVEKYKLNGSFDEFKGESSTGFPVDVSATKTPTKCAAKQLRLYNSVGSNYVCAKCDYLCMEMEDFRQHILLHRKDESSLQCPECGICFVVEPTLRKHLVVAHKVPNVDEYMKSVKVYLEASPTKMICQTSDNQWQCRVCCSTFENESTLKFHLRSHGMAFIRSKVFSK